MTISLKFPSLALIRSLPEGTQFTFDKNGGIEIGFGPFNGMSELRGLLKLVLHHSGEYGME